MAQFNLMPPPTGWEKRHVGRPGSDQQSERSSSFKRCFSLKFKSYCDWWSFSLDGAFFYLLAKWNLNIKRHIQKWKKVQGLHKNTLWLKVKEEKDFFTEQNQFYLIHFHLDLIVFVVLIKLKDFKSDWGETIKKHIYSTAASRHVKVSWLFTQQVSTRSSLILTTRLITDLHLFLCIWRKSSLWLNLWMKQRS